MGKVNLVGALASGADIVAKRDDKFPEGSRLKNMNASEAGTCIRRQYYDRQADVKGDPQSWGMARRGEAMEDWVVERLKAANVPLAYAGAEQETIKHDEWRISGTPDGYIMLDDQTIVLDIKSIDPRTNVKNLPKSHHVKQVQINMALYQATDASKPITGKIFYVDASNYDLSYEFDVAFPDDGFMEDMKARANQILNTKSVVNLDREGQTTGDCRYCPYTKTCGVVLDDAKVAKGRRGTELNANAVAYFELDAQIKEADVAKKALKADIVKAMEKEGLAEKEFSADNLLVLLKTSAGRESVNRERVEQVLAELGHPNRITDCVKTGNPTTTLTIKPLS